MTRSLELKRRQDNNEARRIKILLESNLLEDYYSGGYDWKETIRYVWEGVPQPILEHTSSVSINWDKGEQKWDELESIQRIEELSGENRNRAKWKKSAVSMWTWKFLEIPFFLFWSYVAGTSPTCTKNVCDGRRPFHSCNFPHGRAYVFHRTVISNLHTSATSARTFST